MRYDPLLNYNIREKRLKISGRDLTSEGSHEQSFLQGAVVLRALLIAAPKSKAAVLSKLGQTMTIDLCCSLL